MEPKELFQFLSGLLADVGEEFILLHIKTSERDYSISEKGTDT